MNAMKAGQSFRHGKSWRSLMPWFDAKGRSYRLLLVSMIWMSALLIGSTASYAQCKLYGVVSAPPYQGWLVEINPSTGAATPIGNTTMIMPAGLACNFSTGTIYANDGWGGGPIYTVDPSTGVATAVGAATGAVGCLAYRAADGYLYSVSQGVDTSVLYQISPTTGAYVDFVGVINKGPIGGLDVRASDNVLFGSGELLSGGIQEWLFTISTTPGPPPRETNIGQTGKMITGLAFNPTSNVLYATDSSSLYTVNTSTGALTLVGSHSTAANSIGFVAGLTFAPTPSTTGVDVWIKDCAADNGSIPSSPGLCPEWWTSTDIWIDNNGDNIIDAPVIGANNILKAFVRNRGTNTANGVDVKFYYRDNTTGLIFPDGATLIGQTSVTVSPGGAAVAQVTWTNLPAPPTTGGHWCIGVVLNHPSDPRITPTVLPPQDNNVGIANLWFIAGRAGETVALSFGAGTGGGSGFGFREWPREFVLKVVSNLPRGWSWRLEGPQADRPFVLKLGEERPVKLFVEVDKSATPHSGGFIEVRQMDVRTNREVGGVYYNLYEDRLPPKKIASLAASVIDNHVELTFPQVMQEAESNLRERVAYYQIIRDGKAIDRATIDADKFKPDFQWIDLGQLKGWIEYSVRAVDEGGNVSEVSSAIKVQVPGGPPPGQFPRLFIWLIILLVLIILVLLVLLMKRR